MGVDGQVEVDQARFGEDAGNTEIEYQEEEKKEQRDGDGETDGAEPGGHEEHAQDQADDRRAVGEQFIFVPQVALPPEGLPQDVADVFPGHPAADQGKHDQSAAELDGYQPAGNDRLGG